MFRFPTMKMCFFVIAPFFLFTEAKINLSYSEIQKMGNMCPYLESCKKSDDRFRSGNRELLLPRERNCACDYLCADYGDCCIDAPDAMVKYSLPEFNCLEMKQFGGVFMIDTCLHSYEGPDDVRYQCETLSPGDVTDPIGAMPATNYKTGVTFKNYYCSICNYMTDNLVLWTPRLECPTVSLIESTPNITHEFAFKNLASTDKSWGLYLTGDNGSLFFHDCEIDPVMPMLLESKIRLCRPGLISDWPPDWTDEDVRTMCHSYMGARYIHGGDKYRNAHCALCNGVNTTRLSCKFAESREITTYRTYDTHAFSLLLDINDKMGNEVGMIQFCDNDEIFDPFFKVCRSLLCLPGYKKMGKECVPRGLPDPDENATQFEEPNSGDSPIFLGDPILLQFSSGDGQDGTVTENHDDSVENSTFDVTNRTVYSLTNTSVDKPLQHKLNKLQNCLLISLTDEDYVMLPNSYIYVPKYNKTYEPTSYRADDGSILVCSHLTDVDDNFKFMPLMGYVTTVGLVISMIFLVLHLVVYCLVPELQNLSGKNLASHCIALLCAYLCFLVGSLGVLGFEVCSAISFLTVYFFQVSFFWMAVMAFDVWRCMKMATKELRVAKGKQLKRFFFYSLFAWVMPMLIIVSAAVAEYTDLVPEEYRPSFASPHCWFKSRRALLVYFVSPLIAIVAANICLFCSSAHMLVVAKQSSLKQQNQNQKQSYKLYLRLALLMGLTWVTGFVASYADVEPLWYLFVILNTLQGLFIFVGFSCTTKVFDHFKGKSSEKFNSNDSAATNTSHLSTSSFPSKFFTRIKKSVSPTSSGSNSSIRKVKPLF